MVENKFSEINFPEERDNMHIEKQKSVVVFYYSGVGGTRLVAEVLARMLRLYFEVEIVGVDSNLIVDMSDSDLQEYILKFNMLIFGCPVYRMMPPKPMAEFVSRLARFDAPMRAYTFMTKSGVSGDATLELIKLLEEKNILVGGFVELIAPGTDLNVVIKKRKREGDDFGVFRNFANSIGGTLCGGRGALELVKGMAKDICRIIVSDGIKIKKPKPKKLLMIFWWWLQINFLDKTEEEMHKIKFREPCNKCGKKCVALKCTQNAWVEAGDGKLVFDKGRCVACQMCVNMCPNSFIISNQQEISGTEDFPRLNRKFYKRAGKKFFKGSK